jgi:kynurenine formamidase
MIRRDAPGLWGEGAPYETSVIYDIASGDPKKPPVHYEEHRIRPHSICHFDAPGHTIAGGATISDLYASRPEMFHGWTAVVKLREPKFGRPNSAGVSHWEVSLEELRTGVGRVSAEGRPSKLFLGFEGAPVDFYADTSRAFTISEEAAAWLTVRPGFDLFGTIWKSVDYQPASRERPVHRELFRQSGVIECVNLSTVPEGSYFLSAFPIPFEGATEAPVCPVLYSASDFER